MWDLSHCRLKWILTIVQLNRFQEPGSQGLLCDLLWADPITNYGHETEPSHNGTVPPGTSFLPNATRGCSYFYTYASFPPLTTSSLNIPTDTMPYASSSSATTSSP